MEKKLGERAQAPKPKFLAGSLVTDHH